jgi:preprotein translocase subunit SecA
MAGRGTDILLGGNAEYLAKSNLDEQGIDESNPDYENLKNQALEEARRITEEEHKQVVEAGGLHVIGTERHESRRIDNQLRGRAARQGDPGSTRFFLSLEDNLMRIFGGEKITQLMTAMNIPENMAIDSPLITRRIESAQKKVETFHFDMRKSVLEYDDVMNIQREKFYRQRRRVLSGEGLLDDIYYMMEREVDRLIRSYISPEQKVEEYIYEDLQTLIKELHSTVPQLSSFEVADIQNMRFEPMYNKIKDFVIEAYKTHEIEIIEFYNQVVRDYSSNPEEQKPFASDNIVRQLEKDILLKVIDSKWIDHLHNIDMLREGIGLRAYGQKDPLIEYKKEAYDLFNNMMYEIQSDTVKHLFRTRFGVQVVNPNGDETDSEPPMLEE